MRREVAIAVIESWMEAVGETVSERLRLAACWLETGLVHALCDDCHGEGGLGDERCHACNGHGVVMRLSSGGARA